MIGYSSPCPEWLKLAYRKAVDYTCQVCHKKELLVGKLTPHRVKRGNSGGLYTVCKLSDKLSNVKVICNKCHKKIHSKEFW